MRTFGFEEKHKDKKTNARTGVIRTPHGDIETPAFVPVGTQASVKSLTPLELHALDVHLFFVNTYHMYLRPGLSVIEKAGGLHPFMGWDGPIITDSGGFQVFSLGRKNAYVRSNENFFDPLLAGHAYPSRQSQHPAMDQKFVSQLGKRSSKILLPLTSANMVTMSEDGVVFRSHWDGSEHMFTPELSMQYQWTLGSDIHIAFDDCTGYPVTREKARESMERTHRWAVRSLNEHQKLASLSSRSGIAGEAISMIIKTASSQTPRSDNTKPYQALYGSIQGSVYEDLRKESAKFITSLPFDGYAIGGVAVGENKKEMKQVLDWVTPYLSPDKPRHLLGVGEIDDIFTLVEHGMDTFDCVQPTRLARMGRVYTQCIHQTNPTNQTNEKMYEIDILRAEFAEDFEPIEKDCPCYTCTHFTRGYLHHLFKVRELLGYRLATIHNISFINRLVREIRLAIASDSFVALKKKWGM